MIEVPEGSFLKLRAYKSKQPPGGGTKSAGEDREYANKWSYEYGGTEPSYCWGSSPTFYIEIASHITPMWAAKPTYGLWTHTVTASEGGYACIGDEQGGLGEGANGGLYGSVKTRAPAPGGTSDISLKVEFIPEPGYKLDHWTGDFAPGVKSAVSEPQSGSAVAIELVCLLIDVRCDEDDGCPAYESGLILATPAFRYYDGIPVQLNAIAGMYHRFSHWEGSGYLFPESDGEPDYLNGVEAEGCEVARMFACMYDPTPEDITDRQLTAVFAHCLHGGLPNGHQGQHDLNEDWPEGYLKGDVRMPNPLPIGLGRYPAERDEGGDDWGSHHYIHQKLIDAGATWHASHPDNPILFDDISKEGGGYFGRSSHQNGIDVDVAYGHLPQQLVQLLADESDCEFVFVDSAIVPEGGKIRNWAGHSTHFHVRYLDPDGTPPEN